MLTIDREHCTGCEACVQRCPKKCISLVSGEFDFLYPQIDVSKCVNCRLCDKVCPIEKDKPEPVNQIAYAAVHTDKMIVKSSTSGGAFTALSTAVLNNGGVVYGACMERFVVHHIRVDFIGGLEKLRGSKYLQSRIGSSFVQAEQDLKSGRRVLFSGTPCQIDGLKHFLGKAYDNLITVDIICHGVGSQAYFDKFMTTITTEWPGARELKFRSKRFTGWSCSSGALVVNDKSGRETEEPFYYHENYYYMYFLEGDIYRKSCYSCKFANLDRPGDITLGDFWGVEKLKLDLDTYNGCSLLIVNSEQGHKFLNTVSDLELNKVNTNDAVKWNNQLRHPSELRELRKTRLWDYETKTGLEIKRQYKKTNRIGILKGNLKKMIPYCVKVLIRRGR